MTNSRVLKALLISIVIYALLIVLYFENFSKIEVPSKKAESHIVKLNLIDLPEPVVKRAPEIQTSPSKPPAPKSVPKVKAVEKKVLKKEIKKKEPKIVKKKTVEKKVPKKVVAKKKIEKKVVKPKVVTKKSESLKKFEEEMVYIPNAMIAQPITTKKSVSSLPSVSQQSYPNNKVRKLYGKEFLAFTPTQKKFIKDNLNVIQQITQQTLTRRGYPDEAGRTGQEGTNIVSFNLHPNGDISNLRLKSRIGYRALDDNTLTLIKVAYKDYPYPSTTTKIVFYVTYSIYGY